MDFTAIDLAGWGTLIGATIGAILKAFKSDSTAKAAKAEAEGIKADRQRTATERDEQFQRMREELAVLKSVTAEQGKRLDEGNDRFARFENELKETNGMLRELLGMFKGSGRIKEN